MLALLIVSLALLLTHLGISGTWVRGAMVAAIGEGAYLGLYLLLTLLTMGSLIWLYVQTPTSYYFWYPSLERNWAPKLLLWPALVLLVGGFMVRNPTSVGQGAVVDDPALLEQAASGVNRITRHPFLWAVMLWASSHLIANGDSASVVFFTTFLLLAGLGTLSLDAKKARQLGAGWRIYTQRTSNLPLAAIIRGDNRLRVGELWLPMLVGTALYVAVYYLHEWLTGVAIV